jgi:hypothetical protein
VLAAAAASPVRAQGAPQWWLGALGTTTGPRVKFVGAGPGVGVSPTPRVSLRLLAAGGWSGGGAAGRAEALAAFSLAPWSGRGLEPYVAGGLAATASRGGIRGYATAMVGLALATQRRAGWFGEIGVGGGLRLAAGIRWRPRNR